MKFSRSRLDTAAYFVLDSLANVIDFAFHFWMGRELIPTDFAILQTLNSIALIYVTASGVFQPVIGRFVAEARGANREETIPAIFQSFLRAAFWLAAGLSILVLILSSPLAQLFNLPTWTIQLSAALIFLSSLRPIAAGVLQGQERFIAFGSVRLALSLGRILLVALTLRAGLGLRGAVTALPFGWLMSVLVAFIFLGPALWKKSQALPQNLLREGARLSGFALLAYFAYMSLTSLDLIWVNRTLPGVDVGAYATLVLMRRVVALLPGVAVSVMYPRIAKTLAQGGQTHRLLIQTASVVFVVSGGLTILYFIFAHSIISIVFGSAYQGAAPLLGWMGLAMSGVSLSSIWLNYYLAEQPRNFVILLIIAAALEGILLYILTTSLQNAVLAFGLTGWLLALGGLLIYLSKTKSHA